MVKGPLACSLRIDPRVEPGVRVLTRLKTVKPLAFHVATNADRSPFLQQSLTDGGLAGAGHPSHQDQPRRIGIEIAFGLVQKAQELLLSLLPGGPGFQLVKTEGRDLGSHYRSVNQVVAQQREALIVSADLQVAVQEPLGVISPTPMFEVHSEKGDFIEPVDPAKVLIELDGVENQQTVPSG